MPLQSIHEYVNEHAHISFSQKGLISTCAKMQILAEIICCCRISIIQIVLFNGEFTHSFSWCFKEIWSTVFYWKFFRLCNHQKVQEKRISVSNTWLGPRIDQVWKSLRAEIITEKLLLKQCWTKAKNGPADHSDVDSRELWRELKRRRYKCFAKRCS